MPQRVVAVQAVGSGDAGAVHQRIHPGKTGEGGVRGGGVGDVAEGEPMADDGGVARQDQHVPTLGREAVRDGETNAARAAGDDGLPHWAVPPPSTGSTTPVMKDAASEVRKATALAISEGLAKRPRGTEDL